MQQTLARHLFLPFVTLSTLLVAVGSRSEDLNNLRCRFTSAFLLPICLTTTLLLVAGPEKCRSMDKRRNTPSQCCVIPILAILLIIAGDVELNPGPFKMVLFINLIFICSLPLVITVDSNRPNLIDLRQFPVKDGFKDIVSEIQNDYQRFGTLLLEDKNGVEVKTIEKAKRGVPVDITVEILQRWLQGKGRLPVTWQTFIECLRDAKLHVVADDIEDALSKEALTGILPALVAVVAGGSLVTVVVMMMKNNHKDNQIYAAKLKRLYSKARKQCSSKQWPPLVTKKFFNLALIKEETVRKGEVSDEFTRLTITGKVGDILKQKVPINLQEVFNKADDEQKMTILFEGIPGSGKTALTLHLCLEWVDGKLFQDKLVILVRLREPSIHKARKIKEILPHVGIEDEIANEIVTRGGNGVLFILDGWDELPEDVPGYDIIYQIISRKILPESAIVITSRPTSSAKLHITHLISTRIEILGFSPGELRDYFTEQLDGNTSNADTLLQKISANPIVAGTCALPLNASVLVYIFKQHGDLPTTECGIVEALIRNCILRKLTERDSIQHNITIMSLTDLPFIVKNQFSKLCEIAYNGVMKDSVIFELPEGFNTLGLLQGVQCYTSYGIKYFYSFLHLSIQERLAAQHIANAFEPAEQVAKFSELFGQARFSSTFRYYCAITKLATPGIHKIVLDVLKKCAVDTPSSEDRAHLLSLLNCLYEAQEPSLYKLLADHLGPKLTLMEISLSSADCLSINCFLKYATNIEVNLEYCSISAEDCKRLFSQDQEYHLCALNLKGNHIGSEGCMALSEPMINLQKLSLTSNEFGDDGCKALSKAMQVCKKLEILNLGYNKISVDGCKTLSRALQNCRELRILHLDFNNIKDDGCTVLSDQLPECKKLQELNLTMNMIGAKGCIALSGALMKCKQLKVLIMTWNVIGDDGFIALSKALLECKQLQVLNIWGNKLTDASVKPLTELIKGAKSLTSLEGLLGNDLTQEGKEQIRQAADERKTFTGYAKLVGLDE